MKIVVCGSMQFASEMIMVGDWLSKKGHTVVLPENSVQHAVKPLGAKEDLEEKIKNDLIRGYYEEIKTADAVMIVNITKRGIENYIGGNTLMEIAFAHVLGKKIYLLNPVPDQSYSDEIIAMQPEVINKTQRSSFQEQIVALPQIDLKRGVDYIGANCIFYCHDGRGNILLHRRSQNCRDEQGKWDCGGGSMEHGETFEEALKREVMEEYCVEPLKIDYACSVNVLREHNGAPTHWIANLHAVLIDPYKVRIGEPEKMDEIGWFKPEDFPEDVHSMLLAHFEKIKQFI
jgi:8-oxo-dGTP diphosphatase